MARKSDRPEQLSPITEIHRDENITLLQGDVLQLARTLPVASIDLVLTDPPYCSGGTTSSERTADPVTKYCHNNNPQGRPTFVGECRDQRSYLAWCTMWLSLCRAAAKEHAYCLVFIDWRQLPTMTDAMQAAGWTWRGIAVWNKGRGARSPHKGYMRHQCEYIVWGTNGPIPRLQDRGPFDGCFSVSVKRSDKFHITGKPTELMRDLVKIAPVGGTILDPFAGSGTTLVAATMEDRKAIGFEFTPAYCDVASERIRNSVRSAA